jgi:putative membrane protein
MGRLGVLIAFASAIVCLWPAQGLLAQEKKQDDQNFAKEADQINMAEVKLGKLAEEKAHSTSIRDFGSRMARAHSEANKELREIATKKGWNLTENLDQKHQELFDQLSKLKGEEFDRTFAKDLASGHEEAIRKFEEEANHGQDPDLKKWANKCLPTLREHLTMAQNAQGTATTATTGRTFLGVALAPLDPRFEMQNPNLKGRGVLVAQVAEGSPAQKAGLKAQDIVVSYNDQQVYSAEQLVKLVQNDKPGQQVTLGIVEDGKEKQVKITLAERRATARIPAQTSQGEESSNTRPRSVWETFDSMTLSRTGKDRFKVAISYLDEHGKMQKKEFEGSRQEIRTDLEKQKDLPPQEREQLIRTLQLSSFLRGAMWDIDELNPGNGPNP